MSPFAKLQSISAVYFPQFNELIVELDLAANRFPFWMLEAGKKRIAEDPAYLSAGFNEAYGPYAEKREALLRALKKFAHDEFQ